MPHTDISTRNLPPEQALRLALLNAGYTPLPAKGKAVTLNGWRQIAPTDSTVRGWSKTLPDHVNTGIRTGAGIVAVDIDVLDEAVANRLAERLEKLTKGKKWPPIRFGRKPKCLLLMRVDEDGPKMMTGKYRDSAGKDIAQIEILADGQQFIAFGIHPDTGNEYVWQDNSPLNIALTDLPTITRADLKNFLDDANLKFESMGWKSNSPPREVVEHDESESDYEELSPADLDGILSELSKQKEWLEDRSGWLKVGMALHNHSGGSKEGLATWTAFSKTSSHFNAQELRKDWNSFQDKPGGVTVGTLIAAAPEWAKARQAEWEAAWAAEIDAELNEPLTEDEREDGAGTDSEWGGNVTDMTPDMRMVGATASMPYLIKHLIYEAAQVVIWGLPNAGKSVLAPYLGMRVAQGKGVFGRRVTKAPVIYGSFEGAPAAMQRRIAALHEKCGPAPDFHLVQRLGSLLLVNGKPSRAERTLHKMIKAYGAKLLFIDTLAAAFAGINEDKMSSDGTGVVLAFVRRISDLGCAVVIVHHPKKDGSDMRGSSGLLGAVDLTIRVEAKKTDGSMYALKQSVARSEKVRDTAGNDVMAFNITQHVFGQDSDGDDVTTVYCEEIDDYKDDNVPDLTPSETKTVEALRKFMTDSDIVDVSKWRESCVETRDYFPSEDRDTRKRSFNRAIKGLEEKRFIKIEGNIVTFFKDDSDES